jgi:hypothetical protein
VKKSDDEDEEIDHFLENKSKAVPSAPSEISSSLALSKTKTVNSSKPPAFPKKPTISVISPPITSNRSTTNVKKSPKPQLQNAVDLTDEAHNKNDDDDFLEVGDSTVLPTKRKIPFLHPEENHGRNDKKKRSKVTSSIPVPSEKPKVTKGIYKPSYLN